MYKINKNQRIFTADGRLHNSCSFYQAYCTISTMSEMKKGIKKERQITKLLSLYTANLLSQRQDNPVRGQHGVVA